MSQTTTEQNWGFGIQLGRQQMVAPGLCLEPCEQCGSHEDGQPVINIMPDGCIAPPPADGGRRLCIRCSVNHLRIDRLGGHLAWFEEPFGNGYMLFRVYNTLSGSSKHPNTNCVYRVTYTDRTFKFSPMRCIDCGRDISMDEHQDNITADSYQIMRGDSATVDGPVVADAEYIDRKAKATIKAIGKQSEVLVVGGDAKDAYGHMYDQFVTALLVADLEDIHKGHKYVLKKNGVVASARSRS